MGSVFRIIGKVILDALLNQQVITVDSGLPYGCHKNLIYIAFYTMQFVYVSDDICPKL